MKNKYSIVVPVYNSEDSLTELCNRIHKTFIKIKQDYEIILVDDCSKDNSWTIMNQLNKKNRKIKVIQLMKNFGQNSALMCGFNHARGDYIITIDDDLQNPPEELPKMINKINQGYDVVYGVYRKKKHNIFRNAGSIIGKKFFSKVSGIKFNVTSFRIFTKKVRNEIIKFDSYNVNVNVLLAYISNKVGRCFVKHKKREHGMTNYSLNKLIRYTLDLIFNSTIFPLRLATLFGLIFSTISFIISLYFIMQYYFNNIIVGGFTSTILSITFLSGIILLIIGIIGEYIGRIFLTLHKKPQYIIRQTK
jgi:polyisoprenyl-phosphate glycosyltransferase